MNVSVALEYGSYGTFGRRVDEVFRRDPGSAREGRGEEDDTAPWVIIVMIAQSTPMKAAGVYRDGLTWRQMRRRRFDKE